MSASHLICEDREVPTYQYACTDCDERFELLQAFSDPTLEVHEPGCGGAVRKLFGSVGVVFKGSGFYRNDSRASTTSSDAAVKSESKSDSKSDSKSESTSKSESKSDSKSESKPSAKSESKSGASAAA